VRDPRLTDYAKSMRREPTPPESRLWLQLRARRFERAKFRHQKVIGAYIADFACRDPMLVIELDGDTHGTSHTYDAVRTTYLEARGYRVLRFTNVEILNNLSGVLEVIASTLTSLRSEDRLR